MEWRQGSNYDNSNNKEGIRRNTRSWTMGKGMMMNIPSTHGERRLVNDQLRGEGKAGWVGV